ncbi:hypothetical protein, partial [Streptomyces sp. NPDC050263]|uniref:hypothetical protein n=1 Tax=Streptomyces sp. NPDC050263 TaxID=3155037 RepID=UPI00342F9174
RTSGRHTESTHRTPLLDGQTLPAAALDQAWLREAAEALEDRVERHVTVLADPFAAQDQDAATDLHQRPSSTCHAGLRHSF